MWKKLIQTKPLFASYVDECMSSKCAIDFILIVIVKKMLFHKVHINAMSEVNKRGFRT